MATKKQCWARSLGTCLGPITGEHYVSKALFADVIEMRGFPWCREEFKAIGNDNAKSHILCEFHNNSLSSTDSEAKRFRDGLPGLFSQKPIERPKQGRVKKKVLSSTRHRFFVLDGQLFSRWLCKTYCGTHAAAGKAPSLDFVKYAFGHDTLRRMFFYLPVVVGIKFALDARGLSLTDYYTDDGDVIFTMSFYGLPWVVSNFDLRALGIKLPLPTNMTVDTSILMDRLTEAIWTDDHRITPRVLGKLTIDW
jgi:hypothetical protein